MNSRITNIENAIKKFRLSGYIYNFKLKGDALWCKATEKWYSPDQVTMNLFRQVELDKDKTKRRLIFALESKDGVKGILDLKTVGLNGMKVLAFMDKVKVKLNNNKHAINL